MKLKWMLAGAALLVMVVLTAYHFRPPPKPSPAPPPADTRDGRWRQDLSYLAQELPRLHGNAFFKLKRQDFETAVRDLDAAIPGLSDDEISVSLARIVAMVGDAHAKVFVGTKRLPISLYWFQDGIFVVAAHPGFRSALRTKVVRIGQTGIEEAARRAGALVASEGSEGWLRLGVTNLLVQADVLHGLGIVPTGDAARFELQDSAGAVQTVDLEPIKAGETVAWQSGIEGTVPEYRAKRPLAYWFDYWPDSRTLYFEYNRCTEMPEKRFAEFCRELFAVADETSPERLVIDLRTNEGGNSGVLSPFMSGLRSRPSLDRKDRVYVLIGRRTFSSACRHAREFRSSGKATLVGEPTGGNPFSPFSEFMQFSLPNSKLPVGLTWKFNRFRGAGAAVEPDLRVDVLSADYFAGRDVTLDTALGRGSR